ncbi:MAG: glycerophosphodiester phosphodiesterase [Candidatus Sericytochromatia bacterium]
MSLIRWMAPVALLLITSACAQAPAVSPLAASARGGMDIEAQAKPGPYDKYFMAPVKPARFPVKVIAHRGYSKVAPENTLAAFKAAIDADADVLEIDVQRTKDGQLVVIHDHDVERTTDGKGEVEDMTLEQIKQLDAGGWFGPAFVGERVPTLDEVLSLAKGRANVMIEIKGRKAPLVPPLVAQSLSRFGMAQDVIVSSFYYGPLESMRVLTPNLSIGALVLPTHGPAKRARALQASTAQAYFKAVAPSDVRAAHDSGLQVHVWTVNEPEDIARMAKAGVDGIITDDVATCQQVLTEVFWKKPEPETRP